MYHSPQGINIWETDTTSGNVPDGFFTSCGEESLRDQNLVKITPSPPVQHIDVCLLGRFSPGKASVTHLPVLLFLR